MNYFSKGNPVDLFHRLWTTSGCPIHHEPMLVAQIVGHQDIAACSPGLASSRCEAQKLAGGGRRGKGGEPATRLTRVWEVVMGPSDGYEEAVVVVLSGGGARAQRGEKESGETCGGGRRGLCLL
jgi:hypothetical protein